METPPDLSWDELKERLTKIMVALPPAWSYNNRDPCMRAILRLRDISDFTGISRKHLYYIRRGERTPQLFTEKIQRTLSWFFFNWDRGALRKEEQADGSWRIVFRDPQPQVSADATHARQTGLSAQISWESGRLKVVPR